MIFTDFLVYFKTNLATLAAVVNCTIAQGCTTFCLLKIGKLTTVICYVRHGIAVLYSTACILQKPYILYQYVGRVAWGCISNNI